MAPRAVPEARQICPARPASPGQADGTGLRPRGEHERLDAAGDLASLGRTGFRPRTAGASASAGLSARVAASALTRKTTTYLGATAAAECHRGVRVRGADHVCYVTPEVVTDGILVPASGHEQPLHPVWAPLARVLRERPVGLALQSKQYPGHAPRARAFTSRRMNYATTSAYASSSRAVTQDPLNIVSSGRSDDLRHLIAIGPLEVVRQLGPGPHRQVRPPPAAARESDGLG